MKLNPRLSGRLPAVMALCAMVLLGWASPARAQTTPEAAVLTEWDVFAATGGTSTASQNVAAVVIDVSGKAGTAGSVWLTTQMPLPRIGVINPATSTSNYTEWRPITTAAPGGPPLGLALNSANGDLWMAMAGDPSFVVKTANSNVFRRFRSSYALTPKGIVVAGDNSAIAALPGKNSIGIGNAIVKVPRGGASGTTVTITLWTVGGEPHFVALDGSGNIWFNERAANKLGRLNPSTGLVAEWALPSGTLPVGLQVSGSLVCLVSEGFPNALTGVEHCLNAANNQITTYARVPGDGFNYPQRTSINSDQETFITEPTSNAISFVAFAARAAAAVATVTPTTRTVAPTTSTLTVSDVTIAPTVYSITPTTTTLTGADNGGGHVRFSLPVVNDQAPQPVSLTPVFNDQGRGTGSVFFGESFNGPAWGRFTAGRLARLVLTAAAPEPTVIVANPQALQFHAVIGQAAPGSATIAITENNGGSLSWTATESASWLSVSPASGSAPASLTVTANHASLAAGTYTQDITIDDGPGGADPKTVAVTLNVTQPNLAPLSPASLTFSAVAGGNLPAEQTVSLANSGSGSLDWVATANQGWVVLRQTSGSAPSTISITVNPADLNGGTQNATVTITAAGALNSPRTLAIAVNVTNPPTIALSPVSMTFTALKGAAAPAAQSLTISNSGSGTLQWTAESDSPWLAVSPASGSGNGAVFVSVNHAALAPGVYTGNISILDPDASNSPQILPISLTVTQPTITLTPSTLTVDAIRTQNPANQTVAIGNSGDGALNYTATVMSGGSWLSIASGATGTVAPAGSANLVLAIASASLAAGVYTATVDIADPAATNTPQTLNVTLTVKAPTIVLTPTSLTFTTNEGSNPATQTFQVSNTGDAPLTFTPSVTAGAPGGWLAVSPAGSTTIAPGANTTLTVTVTSAALAPASHSGSIAIADSTATNSPQSLAVALTVNGVPILNVSPTAIPLTAAKGGSNPANQTVTISNTGSVALNYSGSVTSGAAWLSIAGGGTGSVAPAANTPLTLAIDISSLNKGVHVGTIQVAAPGATNAPQTITVTLTIQAATISLSPTSLTYTVLRGRNPTSQTITLTNTGDAPMSFNAATSTVSGGSWLAVYPANGTLAAGASTALTAAITSASLASGSYSGSVSVSDANASNSPQAAAVALTINPAPTIGLGTTSLTYTVAQGANPATQTVTVTNTGDASLTFTPAVTTVSGGAWLSVSPAGATTLGAGASQVLTVSVASASLASGPYSGNIQIADANATNTPQDIAVALTVNAAAVLTRTPATLTFSALRTRNPAPQTQTIAVTNNGDATLNFTAAASMNSGAGWLAVSPASGAVAPGATANLMVTVTSGALATGGYSGIITITDPVATNSPQTTAVSLTVSPAPTISLSAATRTFTATQSENPAAPQAVTVSNTGDASLTFTPQTLGGAAWLAVTPAGASTVAAGGNTALTFTVTSAGLAPGVYTETVRISDVTATNDPQDVAVTLTVNAAPVISRSPATLTYTAKRTTNPATQTITLTNSGGASMSWTAAATMNNGAGWLAVSPTSGTLAAGAQTTLTVAVTSSALTTGSYSGNVAIAAPGTPAGNSPQNTAVSLSVTAAPTISLSATTRTYTVKQTLNPAAQTVTVTNTGDASLAFIPQNLGGATWLAVTPSTQSTVAAGGNTVLTFTVTSASLAPGVYTETVQIVDASATNSPQDVAVTLTVTAAPVITRSPASLTFATKFRANPATQTITLQNTGAAAMNYTAAATMNTGTGWLSVSPASGTVAAGGSTTLTVTVDVATGSLASGSYSGFIRITDATAAVSPVDTPVSLTVTAAPRITPSTAAQTFSGARYTTCNAVASGTALANQTFTVNNSGDTTLAYTTTTNATWLTVSPTSGSLGAGATSAAQTVSVNLAPGGTALAAGSYSGTITVTDPAASNPNQTIAVSLTVTAAAATLCVEPSLRALALIPNGSATTTTFSVKNVGDSGTIAATVTAPAAVTRHTITRSPTSGSVTVAAPVTVTISITPNSSPAPTAGAKSTTFTVTATGQTTRTQTVTWSNP